MKLLIVDDEPIIRMGIKKLVDLKAMGITELLEAANGETGLEIFIKAQPDIVLADINMPRMNGLEFAERIKFIKPSVKIAIVTGYDYFEYARQGIKVGVDDYILKPVSKKDIEQLLEKLVDRVKSSQKAAAVIGLVHRLENDNEMYDETGYKAQIAELLEIHMNQPDFSLSFLADELGLSMGYLSGLFKKIFGITFKEYVLTKRLDQAKLLLLSSQMKNYEISEAVGIIDPNYFSAAFKKRFGYSPSQYREKVRD
ncbi:response regulator transcription factor [Petrocella sp. FN5]|uniref:response regulator transcription factor n=1 Tax=Petrocella sp. FN5 TaxID=3032002 RepID=UPI0023DC1A35|nr:response regulator [Petrocella sp. FN5]MDF1618595.1 response regulator [Petrocella sp. FN5]